MWGKSLRANWLCSWHSKLMGQSPQSMGRKVSLRSSATGIFAKLVSKVERWRGGYTLFQCALLDWHKLQRAAGDYLCGRRTLLGKLSLAHITWLLCKKMSSSVSQPSPSYIYSITTHIPPALVCSYVWHNFCRFRPGRLHRARRPHVLPDNNDQERAESGGAPADCRQGNRGGRRRWWWQVINFGVRARYTPGPRLPLHLPHQNIKLSFERSTRWENRRSYWIFISCYLQLK